MQTKTRTGVKVEKVFEVIDSGFESRVNGFTADMFDGTARVQRNFHDLFWKIENLVQDNYYNDEPLGNSGLSSFPYGRCRLEARWKIGSEPWKDTALYLHSRYNGLIIPTSDIQS